MPSSFLMIRPPPRFTLFPYRTLFRSRQAVVAPARTRAGADRERERKLNREPDRGAPEPFAPPPPPASVRLTLPPEETSAASTHDAKRDRKSTRLNSSHANISYAVFFFNDTAPTEIYPLSLQDALPISAGGRRACAHGCGRGSGEGAQISPRAGSGRPWPVPPAATARQCPPYAPTGGDQRREHA